MPRAPAGNASTSTQRRCAEDVLVTAIADACRDAFMREANAAGIVDIDSDKDDVEAEGGDVEEAGGEDQANDDAEDSGSDDSAVVD